MKTQVSVPVYEDGGKQIPKVSVIIPVHNVELYLEECLQSVIRQTLQDIEIICVDDGSTDGSADILKKYADCDSRISVTTQVKGGVSSARNTGVGTACGKYLYFLDSDDYIEEDTLEFLYSEAERKNLDLLFFDGRMFNDSDLQEFPEKEDYCRRKNSYDSVYSGQELFCAMRKNDDYKPMVWLMFISRDFYNKKRLHFREGIIHEDVIFAVSCTMQAEKASHCGKNFYHYRQRKSSITTSAYTFANVHGRLAGIIALSSMTDYYGWNEEVQKEMLRSTRWFETEIKRIYASLTDEEKKKKETLSPLETVFFEKIISEPRKIEYVKQECSDCKKEQAECPDCKKSREKYIRCKKERDKYRKQCKKYRREIKALRNSASFRVGRMITWLPLLVLRFFRYLSANGIRGTLKRILNNQNGNKNIPENKMGCSERKHKPELIVSLTSYPARINTVHKTIGTILQQTERPDRVILWLAKEQFPKRERELPEELLSLKKCGLTIGWCHDIKSYKKLIPTLKKYPEAIIVTTDDDVYYDKDWLEKLYKSYLKQPGYIHCHRSTKFRIEEGRYKYKAIEKYDRPTYLHKLVGIGGVLYPPHSLHPDILREDLFTEYAKTNDDLWFWFMAIRNGYRILVVDGNNPQPTYIEGSQEVGLTKINDQGPKRFDTDLQYLLDHYPDADEKLKEDYEMFK